MVPYISLRRADFENVFVAVAVQLSAISVAPCARLTPFSDSFGHGNCLMRRDFCRDVAITRYRHCSREQCGVGDGVGVASG